MENEGSSALQPETPKDNITPFPGTEKDNISQFPTQATQLPSEKVAPFLPNRETDMQTLDFLLYLPKGRSGFTFRTDQALTKGPQKYDDVTAESIRKKTEEQMAFTQGKLAKEALDQYRKNPTKENKELYETARVNYLERSSPKVGIRNIRISGDNITIDTQPVDFQVNAALGNLNSSAQDIERGTVSATSGNVIFAPDKFGKRKIGLMLRNQRNGSWRGVPGTLIAGYFDGKLDVKPSKLSPRQGRRTLEKIDNQAILGNALKELHEEIGIDTKDVKKSFVAGLSVEKKYKAHHEFLVDIEVKLTAEQAREKSDKFIMDHPEEFKEDWTTIDYTPEAIQTLLTKVLCPLPNSHYASYAATARKLVAETKGQKTADEFVKNLQIGITENKERINSLVRQYLRDNPDVMTRPTQDQQLTINKKVAKYAQDNPNATDEEKEKFTQGLIDGRVKFDPDGFNPALLPEEQGLPDVFTALKLAGLIPETNISQFPQQAEQTKAA